MMGIAAVIIGVLLLAGGRVYSLYYRPEWTEMISLLRLWWLWLLGAALMAWGSAWLAWRSEP